MAHKLTVELTNEQYDTLAKRVERNVGEGAEEDDAALADDLVHVWWGRLKALEKHQGKVKAVKADPIGAVEKGITFEPRRPLLAPDAIDVDRLVALGIAPAPKAHTMAEAHAAHAKVKAPKASKAKAGMHGVAKQSDVGKVAGEPEAAPKAKASKAKAAQTSLPLAEPKAKVAQS